MGLRWNFWATVLLMLAFGLAVYQTEAYAHSQLEPGQFAIDYLTTNFGIFSTSIIFFQLIAIVIAFLGIFWQKISFWLHSIFISLFILSIGMNIGLILTNMCLVEQIIDLSVLTFAMILLILTSINYKKYLAVHLS